MNKKEIAEIRKAVNNYGIISKLCGCYVNHEKKKILTYKNLFAVLDEKEENRYHAIFKKSLSGRPDTNLFNLDLVSSARGKLHMYELLRQLNDSELADDDLIEEFYDAVIDSFPYGENYLILMINSLYDVPGRGTDGEDMDDASDYVHKFINIVICPVKLSKEGLFYNEYKNNIETRMTDRLVEAPLFAMMFPSFNERFTDDHELLLYLGKDSDQVSEFIEKSFDCRMPVTAKKQKEIVTELIDDTLSGSCDSETVSGIYSEISRRSEAEEEYIKKLDKGELKNILSSNGVPEERLRNFEKEYEERFDADEKINAENLINKKAVVIKTANVEIKTVPEFADSIEERIVDGRKCLVIPVSDFVKFNDISVNI